VDELIQLLKEPQVPTFSAFQIPFHHYFLGSRLCFGKGQNEKHIRLFRKDRSHYGAHTIHEGIEVDGPVGFLRHPIQHYSYRNIQDYLDKCNQYTTLIAKEKYSQGVRFHLWDHLRLPWEFFYRSILRGGLLDGTPGIVYAVLSSYYMWLKFVKLRDLEEKRL
jgi:hypothetical protein